MDVNDPLSVELQREAYEAAKRLAEEQVRRLVNLGASKEREACLRIVSDEIHQVEKERGGHYTSVDKSNAILEHLFAIDRYIRQRQG